MKPFIIFLLILLFSLQYKIWFAPGGVKTTLQLKQAMEQLQTANNEQQQKNNAIVAEIEDLQQGTEAIEENARLQLGMIKNDEVFYQLVQ